MCLKYKYKHKVYKVYKLFFCFKLTKHYHKPSVKIQKTKKQNSTCPTEKVLLKKFLFLNTSVRVAPCVVCDVREISESKKCRKSTIIQKNEIAIKNWTE